MSTPLLVDRGGDDYYVGPLEPALRVMADSVTEITVHRSPRGWGTRTVDYNGAQRTEHEWGNGPTLEEALRYLIGAHFGPLDAEFDEARLRAMLIERSAP